MQFVKSMNSSEWDPLNHISLVPSYLFRYFVSNGKGESDSCISVNIQNRLYAIAHRDFSLGKSTFRFKF